MSKTGKHQSCRIFYSRRYTQGKLLVRLQCDDLEKEQCNLPCNDVYLTP